MTTTSTGVYISKRDALSDVTIVADLCILMNNYAALVRDEYSASDLGREEQLDPVDISHETVHEKVQYPGQAADDFVAKAKPPAPESVYEHRLKAGEAPVPDQLTVCLKKIDEMRHFEKMGFKVLGAKYPRISRPFAEPGHDPDDVPSPDFP